MVTLNMESVVETPKELWWAYSPDLGWVVQDRSLFVNRCWDFTEEMTFIRCSDWSEYTQGEQAWNYKEAKRYLASLSQSEALVKRNELEACKARFCENRELVA